MTLIRSHLQHSLWNRSRSNGESRLSAYLFMKGNRRNVRMFLVPASPNYLLSVIVSTIRLARRKHSTRTIQRSLSHRIGRSSSLTPPGSIPSRQKRLSASGWVLRICNVEVSMLTFRDCVGSRLFMSLIKSSEAIMLSSILYRSANLRLF